MTSQGKGSNVDTGFCENQNDIDSSNESNEYSQIKTKSRSTINMSNATEACQAKNKSKRKSEGFTDVQLR